MTRPRTTKRDRNRGPVAPQVFSIARAAANRVQKLLAICDARIEAIIKKSKSQEEPPICEIQAVVRMTLSLQKEWDKYAMILYPATDAVSIANKVMEAPAIDTKAEAALISNDLNKTNALLQESVSSPAQDLEALQAGGLSSVMNRGIQRPSEKRQAKAEKFSQSFFQKRPQIVTP